ncbi:MAG: hypothetical protein WEA24_04505 [Gemmatimonadota bacterium]
MTAARLARGAAVAIALAALLDPAVTTARRSAATVAVVAADQATDSARAERVAERLGDAFTVVRGPLPTAAASVIVGSAGPRNARALGAPVFAVQPDPATGAATLIDVAAPATAPAHARVPVAATVRVRGGAGRQLQVTLGGLDAPLDRATVAIEAPDQTVRVPLAFVPAMSGPHTLRVEVSLEGGPGAHRSAHVDHVVHVAVERWNVLFVDGRPAWPSTFARRALEQDARFAVSSRVRTAPGVATEAGTPPPGFSDAAAMDAFEAVVIGAPETLAEADVAALERYLRRRGGAVILLPDRAAAGPYRRLTGAASWVTREVSPPVEIRGGAALADRRLRTRELLVPAPLPAGARPVAWATGPDSAPVVWQTPVGAGRLIVSGALDAWRHRGADLAGFEAFWSALIGAAAAASPPPLELTYSIPGAAGAAAPGGRLDVGLTMRAAALAPPLDGRSVSARVSGGIRPLPGGAAPDAEDPAATSAARSASTGSPADPTATTPLRFWPTGAPGRFRATLDAPTRPGTYLIEASADGVQAELPLVVLQDAGAPSPDPGLLAAWVASRGGAALPETELDGLLAALRERLDRTRQRELWHPMRSPWWILPFALLLGGEWLWRRRRGLA